MRKNLISILVVTLLFCVDIFASTYQWDVEVDKKTVYTDEAIYLKYRCSFSDRGELYVIDFNPVVSNENYTIKLLSEKSKIVDGKRINSYEYIAYIHKAGDIRLSLDGNMRKTNQDSIENTVIGRDNGEYEEFTQTPLNLQELEFIVKDSSHKLVGEFELVRKITSEDIDAYEPFNIDIKILGKGNFVEIKDIVFDIEDVKIFSQNSIRRTQLTQKGQEGVWSQRFAFVAEKDFSIPHFTLEYFDLKTQTSKSLVFDAIDVKVNEVYKKEELIDKEQKSNFEFDLSHIYYLLSFIAGYMVAKIPLKKEKSKDIKKDNLLDRINNVKSFDELVFYLILANETKYQSIIKKIESKEFSSLKEAKKFIYKI